MQKVEIFVVYLFFLIFFLQNISTDFYEIGMVYALSMI